MDKQTETQAMTVPELVRASVKRACASDTLGGAAIRNAITSVYDDRARIYVKIYLGARPEADPETIIDNVSSFLLRDAAAALLKQARKP